MKPPQPNEHPAPLVGSEPEPPDGAKRIYLVRHVQSRPWGDPWAMDPDITERGVAQLQALTRHFAGRDVDLIVTSELLRARKTAHALEDALDADLVIDEEWNEFHTVGSWRSHPLEVAQRLALGRYYLPDQRQPEGESLRELYRRIQRAWERLLALPVRNLLLVGHNAVLGTLVAAAFGLREDSQRSSLIAYPHAAVSELWVLDTTAEPTLPDRVTMLRYLCHAEHLQSGLLTY